MADKRCRCSTCGGTHDYGVDIGSHSPYVVLEDQNLHIEALRAASRIVAGVYSSGVKDGIGYGPLTPDKWTTLLAEHFALWLETGEK